MSIATLLHRHVFGYKADVTDGFWYIDEQNVLYASGHNTVIYSLEQRTQRFIPGTEKTDEITAYAISPNKKYVAVAEKAEKGTITIYELSNLKRRRLLTTSESQSMTFVSLCFSPDGKYLLAQGGAPDWTLLLWTWEKAKLTASAKASNAQNSPIYQVSFNPADGNTICVTGNGILRLYKLAESNLKQLPSPIGKREPQNFLCHCWVGEDRLLAGTDQGEILLMEAGEFRTVLPKSPMDGISIESMVAYSKGVVCGGSSGQLFVYEKSDDKEYYRRSKTFRIENNSVKVKALAVSPSEETLTCALENHQLYSLTLSNIDILKPEDTTFDLVVQPFHSSMITGMDVCIRKPLLVTCSVDKTVRLWNYMEKVVDLSKTFTEEAYSVAFHPSGFHILVGFADKLRLMNVLMDDIRTYKEFAIKACRECRFSHGGQYFAAVNGNTVNIFSTYTCENIGNLRGHNGKVRSVVWTADDTRLVTAGMDGAVYEWKLKDCKRESENVLKSCNYTCVAVLPDGRCTFAVGSDKKLKEISENTVNKDYSTGGSALTQVVLSNTGRMLFAGSESGTLRSYKFPLTGEYQEYQAHAGPVARLAMSYDDSMLLSTGEDGSLFILDVREKEARSVKREKELLPFAEEILVTKSDLEEKTSMMNDLKQRVEELTFQIDYQIQIKEMAHNEKIKEMTENFTRELEVEKGKYEMLLQDKNDLEMDTEEKIKSLEEQHREELLKREQEYQQRIMAEVERYQALQEEKDLLNERWDEQNSLLVESHERVIQELTDDFDLKLQEQQMLLEREREEKEEMKRMYEETQRQIEEDADREIDELKERYEGKLASVREEFLRLKGENGIMRKKFDSLNSEIDKKSEKVKDLLNKQKDREAYIETLEKEIAGLQKEIKERDDTIGDKEKRIYDLKKKNQELEKFKFVLDYKIKELRKQIVPREKEIALMKEQIKEMDAELELYHKNNSKLELQISDLKLKLEGLQREGLHQRQRANDLEGMLQRYRNDLHETIQYIQEPKALKESVKKLYQRHVRERVPPAEMDADIQKEYNRQREYLEKTVDALKKKVTKDAELHKSETMRIMQENVALIREINELRREMKSMKQAQRAKELAGTMTSSARSRTGKFPGEAMREIDMQKETIRQLRERIQDLENGLDRSRPRSRERLPPMDGFAEGPAGGSRVPTPPEQLQRRSRQSSRRASRQQTPPIAPSSVVAEEKPLAPEIERPAEDERTSGEAALEAEAEAAFENAREGESAGIHASEEAPEVSNTSNEAEEKREEEPQNSVEDAEPEKVEEEVSEKKEEETGETSDANPKEEEQVAAEEGANGDVEA